MTFKFSWYLKISFFSSFQEPFVKTCGTIELGGGGGMASTEYSVCKGWCDKDNCNNNEIHEPHVCYQCSATVNQFNETSGISNIE